jgi:hypothetical protein
LELDGVLTSRSAFSRPATSLEGRAIRRLTNEEAAAAPTLANPWGALTRLSWVMKVWKAGPAAAREMIEAKKRDVTDMMLDSRTVNWRWGKYFRHFITCPLAPGALRGACCTGLYRVGHASQNGTCGPTHDPSTLHEQNSSGHAGNASIQYDAKGSAQVPGFR